MLKPGPEMEVDEWKRLIEAYASAGVTQFSFTGGDGLLHCRAEWTHPRL
jgi:MoaA/NifB/PqqE/SkfB family radical SAM enzyme